VVERGLLSHFRKYARNRLGESYSSRAWRRA
jgi:hypothetical protein